MIMSNKCAKLLKQGLKLRTFLMQVMAILESDLRKLRHDPYELLTRMIQPALWLLIFGQAMARVNPIKMDHVDYLDFIAPGILAQSILFISIFYGLSLIWERDLGTLHKILVSPCPRVSLVIGRSLAAGIRGMSQAVVIFLLAMILDVKVRLSICSLFGITLFVFLGAALFSTISLIIAALVKRRERFMGIGQVVIMPLFFASNALYPIDNMPKWLHIISHFNPLTYQVDAFRTLMIAGDRSMFGLSYDFAVLSLLLLVFMVIASRIYPKILV